MTEPNPKTRRLVDRAVDQWKKQLVDLTGNNRLIYYRALKSGTLSLAKARKVGLHELLSGDKVRLSDLFDGRPPSEHEDPPLLDAMKRVRTISRTGRVNFEERGIGTMFVSSHLATWDAEGTTKATPNAPVLLAPVRIDAIGGSQRDFELELADDWQVNQTLLIFWQEVFGATVNPELIGDLTVESPSALATYAAGVVELAKATGVIPRVSLSDECLIGNFQYTKLPMVKDLEGAVDLLAQNDVIAAIAGDEEATIRVRNENSASDVRIDIPDQIDPSDEFLVLDADASQSHVINTVVSNRSTIMEGPPGTGKSQTISNLIATLAARGQTVLFVAEKRAAIEAVLKRLEDQGLGDIMLDLHTSVIRKKDLAQALSGALKSATSAPIQNVGKEQSELRMLREQVVGYERELHQKVEPWGQSSFDVNTALLEYADAPQVDLEREVIEALTDEPALQAADVVNRWVRNRKAIDWDSPWVDGDIVSETRLDLLTGTAQELQAELLPALSNVISNVESQLGADLADTSLEEVSELVVLCEEVVDVHEHFSESIWEIDLAEAAVLLRGKRFLRGGGSTYRAAKKALKASQKTKLSKAERLRFVERAAECSERWQKLALPGSPRHPDALAELKASVLPTKDAYEALNTLLTPNAPGVRLRRIADEVQTLVSSEDVAVLVWQTEGLRQTLIQQGVRPLVEAVERGEVQEGQATRCLQHSILLGRKRAIESRNEVLNAFDADDHLARTRRYAAADKWHLDSAAARVAREVSERALERRNQHPDQSALIERETKKKTRHKPLRELQDTAGDVLTGLKPCWMMSPLMVAQTLPAKQIFDFVIFDEASQIRPEEAISAIARGRNLVVAGDRRQLPPSAFFDSANAEVEDYDEDDETVDALTTGYQSILDVTGALLPARMLTWHYRSRDERLISLSNDHIYGGALTTFPGSQQVSPVTFHRVHHKPADKSEVRSNSTEVARVVDLMIEHAEDRPEESLGVIAFGQTHATAIEDALRARLDAEGNRDLDEYFDDGRPERVFVKNIERVQGDERDAIILSVGYGKDPEGRVPRRFGPVNQDGGERRINVAASRARSRMAVVASIAPDEFETSSLGKGPQLLQHLLRFAETGGNETGGRSGAVSLNAFELAVQYELEMLGLKAIPQYGVSGFRIDFALPHPANDGRMVLAVEADGASYHSSHTARDRDRLRQQILEAKGWQFHRIWSTAFFRDPKAEAAKVKETYDRVVRGEPIHSPVEPFVARSVGVRQSPSKAPTRPRLEVGVPINQHDHRKLVALVRWIKASEGDLLTDEEIKERMKEELGYARRRHRIEEAFDRAISGASRN